MKNKELVIELLNKIKNLEWSFSYGGTYFKYDMENYTFRLYENKLEVIDYICVSNEKIRLILYEEYLGIKDLFLKLLEDYNNGQLKYFLNYLNKYNGKGQHNGRPYVMKQNFQDWESSKMPSTPSTLDPTALQKAFERFFVRIPEK